MQVLLIAVVDHGNTAARQQKSSGFIQAVLVVVQREEARLIVAVQKRDLIVLPGVVGIFRREHTVQFGEVVVACKHVAHRRIHPEVQLADAALVRELVGIVIQRVGRACDPFAEHKRRPGCEHRIAERVLPSPGHVLDGIQPEAVRAMGLKQLRCRLQVAVRGGILLVEVRKPFQRVVLQLVAIVEVADVRIVMEDAVRVIVGRGHERAVVVHRAELAVRHIVRVIVRPVHNHLQPVGMRTRYQVVEGHPAVRCVAEMLLHAHEVPRRITVVRRGDRCAAVRVQVLVVHRRRDPDGRHAQALEVGHLGRDAGQVSAPVGVPVGLG